MYLYPIISLVVSLCRTMASVVWQRTKTSISTNTWRTSSMWVNLLTPSTSMYSLSALVTLCLISSLYQDYPSIALVNQRLNENEVIPIFTVPTSYVPAYQASYCMCPCTLLNGTWGQLTGSAFYTVDVTSVFLFQMLRDNFDSANVAENIDDSENLANIIRRAHTVIWFYFVLYLISYAAVRMKIKRTNIFQHTRVSYMISRAYEIKTARNNNVRNIFNAKYNQITVAWEHHYLLTHMWIRFIRK